MRTLLQLSILKASSVSNSLLKSVQSLSQLQHVTILPLRPEHCNFPAMGWNQASSDLTFSVCHLFYLLAINPMRLYFLKMWSLTCVLVWSYCGLLLVNKLINTGALAKVEIVSSLAVCFLTVAFLLQPSESTLVHWSQLYSSSWYAVGNMRCTECTLFVIVRIFLPSRPCLESAELQTCVYTWSWWNVPRLSFQTFFPDCRTKECVLLKESLCLSFPEIVE